MPDSMLAPTEDLTTLLNAAAEGGAAEIDRLWAAIHGDMQEMARRACASEGQRWQLQPTMLVNELFLKMFGPEVAHTSWDDRQHFWGSVGRAMGQFLIDLARRDSRAVRGGNRQRIPIAVIAGVLEDATRALSPDAIAALEALNELDLESPETALVARMRFLNGFSIEETATLLGIAPRTVSKRWNFARAWLRRAIDEAIQRMER